jgi:hypothetical protein
LIKDDRGTEAALDAWQSHPLEGITPYGTGNFMATSFLSQDFSHCAKLLSSGVNV